MRIIKNIVIFGATGDLAHRMLLPSLYSLDQDDLLDPRLSIVCAARSNMETAVFIAMVRTSVEKKTDRFDEKKWDRFSARLRYLKMDVTQAGDFANLAEILGAPGQSSANLFFLSLSPDHYVSVCENIRASGLHSRDGGIIVEKPLGQDLKSSRIINDALTRAFDEKHIFRIDHYLGKETVQNILALRFANVLFEPLWNRAYIDHVRITVFETVGVEGRWGYYNQYGALRDMVQNHVLQLLCLIALEPPARLDPDAVRDEKVKVLRSLRSIAGKDVLTKTVRGQYADGFVNGAQAESYAREAGGGVSDTETFVALETSIENSRWSGVPFILCTGKRMHKRLTEIQIQFREVPHSVFSSEGSRDLTANRLTITLQPEEHVSLALMNKTPGLNSNGMRLSPLALNLSLTEAFHSYHRRIAYEQLLLDALNGNQTLFVRDDEIELAWKWIDQIEEGWTENNVKPEIYRAGSDGPPGFPPMIAKLSRGSR